MYLYKYIHTRLCIHMVCECVCLTDIFFHWLISNSLTNMILLGVPNCLASAVEATSVIPATISKLVMFTLLDRKKGIKIVVAKHASM